MQKAMFDRPESSLTMGAIVVVGDYAITGWAQDGTGGRALLRKTAKGWGIHLCSGESLKDTAALVGMGVPEDVARSLTEQLSAAEAQLDPMLVAEFAKFDGVMMVDESLL
ncbi:MAG: copper uptake system-associated protein [Devosia sp.]